MRIALLFAVVAALVRPAFAGEYVDAKVAGGVCVLARDAAQLGGATGSVPCAAQAPYDTYETRDNGFGDPLYVLAHPRVEREDGRLAADLVAAAALTTGLGLREDSSFLRLSYRPASWAKGDSAQLLVYPYDTDRLRLGFSRAISWGGTSMFVAPPPTPGAALGHAPGAMAALHRGTLDAFVAGKATSLLDRKTNEQEPQGALLLGAGVEVIDGLRVDANGGYFQRGVNPKQEVLGQPVRTFGGSIQLSYLHGNGLSRPKNLAIASDDPTAPGNFFRGASPGAGFSYLVSAEASFVGTTVMDSDHAGQVVTQPARAADLQVQVAYDALRLHFTAMYRDLPFLLQDVPGFVPYVSMGSTATTQGDVRFLFGGDYHLPDWNLTPGAMFFVEAPATYTGHLPTELRGNAPDATSAAVVVRDTGDFSILVPGAARAPELGGRLFARVDLLEHFAGLLSFQLAHAPNDSRLERSDTGESFRRIALPSWVFGANVSVAAGF